MFKDIGIEISASRTKLIKSFGSSPDLVFIRSWGNIGDELIYAGTRQLLSGFEYREVSIQHIENVSGHTALISGGGAWCTTFNDIPSFLPIIEKQFKSVIVLPSSFDPLEEIVRNVLEKTKATVFARERVSYDLIRGLCLADIAYDCAFFFNYEKYKKIGNGVLNAFRSDRESTNKPLPGDNIDISLSCSSLDEWLWTISKYDLIRTDRAHVMIATAMLGKRVEYDTSNYHKVPAIAEYSLKGYPVTRISKPPITQLGISNKEDTSFISLKGHQVKNQLAGTPDQSPGMVDHVQGNDALTSQVANTTGSIIWKTLLFFRRIRYFFAHPNNLHSHLLQQLNNFILFPFNKFKANRTQMGNLTLVKSSGYFDETWYLSQNPDVSAAKVDPLLHYLRFGGFEGRDPCINFSSAWYLDEYPDVKKAGVNPLVHFLKHGKEEGRVPKPAPFVQTLSPRGDLNSNNVNKLKLALVTLVRNEQDILNTFLNHIDVLFDYVLLIDHRSVDSSGDILKEAVSLRNNWTYITLDIAAFYQKETMKLAMQQLFEKGADFVFFLDCDEFIQVENRKDFELIISRVSNPPCIGSFRWTNCFTDDMDSQQFDYESAIIKIIEPSPFSKVFIPKFSFDQYGGNLSIPNGNHHVLDPDGKVLEAIEIGNLIHIPVRSIKQLKRKAIISSLAHMARSNGNPSEGFQFFEMLQMMAKGEISADLVRGCVHLYQNSAKILPISESDLTKGEYSKTSLKSLKIATSHFFSFKFPKLDEQLNDQIVSDQILSWKGENPGNFIYNKQQGRIFIE